MRAREALPRALLRTVDADQTLERAARMMLEGGIRHLPVVDQGRLVGVLSERDLLAFHGYGGLEAPVSMAMSRKVETAAGDDDLTEVAERMAAGKLGCMPVVEGDELVGILTTTDLLGLKFARPPGRRPWLLERTAAEVMTAAPLCVHPDDRLMDALARMSQRGVRHLPVIDGDTRPIAMLSDRDVRRAFGDVAAKEGERGVARRAADYRVQDVASAPVIAVEEAAALSQFVRRFLDDRVGAVAVVDDDGRLTGIVSYIDVLAELVGEVHQPSGVAAIQPEPTLPA